jgi:hypothetical protein
MTRVSAVSGKAQYAIEVMGHVKGDFRLIAICFGSTREEARRLAAGVQYVLKHPNYSPRTRRRARWAAIHKWAVRWNESAKTQPGRMISSFFAMLSDAILHPEEYNEKTS